MLGKLGFLPLPSCGVKRWPDGKAGLYHEEAVMGKFLVAASRFLLCTVLLTLPLIVYANTAFTYSGPVTNTTFNVKGNVSIYFDIRTDNVLSGYINFSQSPGDSHILCGAGGIIGSKQGSAVDFGFTSHDPDPGCGFDWGQLFTVNGTLSEDRQIFEGNYSVSTAGQQGTFRVSATPTVSAPPTLLTRQLTFPSPPSPAGDTLIVIIHGCCTPPGSDISDLQNMASSLAAAPGNTVWLYLWQDDAGGPGDFIKADINGPSHGKYLGTTISASSYKYVHFIGHSAASKLIRYAISTIKTNRDKFGLNDPIIQATFLDAFMGPEDLITPVNSYLYAIDLEDDDYAEHYVDDGLPTTSAILFNAYNFDITGLPHSIGGQGVLGHHWPLHWYEQSAASPGEYGFGFPLSFEYSGNGVDPSAYYINLKQELKSEHNMSSGGVCVLTSNTECISNPVEVLLRPAIVYTSLLGSWIPGAIQTSVTGIVEWVMGGDLVGPSATMTTASPAWFEVPIMTPQTFNLMQFDYEFLSAAGSQGIVTVFVDDRPVYKIDERITDHGVNMAQGIPVGELAPGPHKLSFRLDPFTAVKSVAQISNVKLGELVETPIPGTPNLQPTGITFDTATALVGSTIFFDSGVRNTGDVDTGVFNIKWFVDGQEVGAYGSHAGVPAGQTVMDGNSQFSWPFNSHGLHSVTFAVDVDHHVLESKEGDNLTTTYVVVQP
jgi:hypothetical protein